LVADEAGSDWRLEELRRLGEAERRMELELHEARDTIARLVRELLPAHASAKRIDEIVTVSGFSRFLVEGLRGGRGVWSKL
jgi:hypothetical protein